MTSNRSSPKLVDVDIDDIPLFSFGVVSLFSDGQTIDQISANQGEILTSISSSLFSSSPSFSSPPSPSTSSPPFLDSFSSSKSESVSSITSRLVVLLSFFLIRVAIPCCFSFFTE